MFGSYPCFIDRSGPGFCKGPFFCQECQGLAHVKEVELNVPTEIEGLRNRILVLRCRFHGTSSSIGDPVTNLMRLVPSGESENFPNLVEKLNKVCLAVKRWDLSCCIMSFIGAVCLLLGIGGMLAMNSLGGLPFWLPGLIVASIGLVCLFIAAICLYKSGIGSSGWMSDSYKLLAISKLDNLTAQYGYDQYEMFIDNFCIFKN